MGGGHRMPARQRAFKTILTLALVLLVLGTTPSQASAQTSTSPKNVILLIGDGMGFEQVKAAGMYLNGSAGSLCFESLPYQGQVVTFDAYGAITDSAAASTAMATGQKVAYGVVSLQIPGDGHEIETSLEYHRARGRMVGLVTTTRVSNATPAGFGAHNADRYDVEGIVDDYLLQTKPNVLFGGGGDEISPSEAQSAGYVVVTSRAEMDSLSTSTTTMVSGQFGETNMPYEGSSYYDTLPHLSEMAATALDILDNDPDGFFLMIEGGNIDHACHGNQLGKMIYETIEFNHTIQVVLDWAANRSDTLIVVTADHETGGLQVVRNNGQGQLPTVTWSSTSHTGANVGIWATGPAAQAVYGVMDNTEIHTLTTVAVDEAFVPVAPAGTLDLRISSPGDDVEQSLSTGVMYAVSSDLELGGDPDYLGAQDVGLRFANIQVPQASTIVSACLVFTPDRDASVASSLTLRGEAADDSSSFSQDAWNLTNRSRTTASVSWPDIHVWSAAGGDQTSPSIVSIVQEIVDRPGWMHGNAMTMIASGSGTRPAISCDENASAAPLLHIEYAPASAASVTLSAGWNLVSLPCATGEMDPPTALASIAGEYTWVKAYVQGPSPQRWRRYGANLPPYTNTLTKVDETMGLWILANSACELTVPGIPATGGYDIELFEGWNLVGYPSQVARPVEEVFGDAISSVQLVQTYESTGVTVSWDASIQDGAPESTTLSHMGPDHGYWVQVSEDCTWHVPED